MSKITDDKWARIYTEANIAAVNAINKYIEKYGEPFYCGFAWVNVGATHPFIKWLKKTHPRVGHKGYPKGWDIWNPGGYPGQSMDVKEVAANAFADVLKKHGISCYANSRAD